MCKVIISRAFYHFFEIFIFGLLVGGSGCGRGGWVGEGVKRQKVAQNEK